MSVDVALVTLGRPSALGETRRVASWRRAIEEHGATVATIELTRIARARPWAPPGVGAIVTGRAVPETATWSLGRARAALAHCGASRAVFVTSRSFHPALLTGLDHAVLDLVDQLSRSYDDRALVARNVLLRRGLRLLARSQRRAEQLPRTEAVVAAGWEEARLLDATWFPNVVDRIDQLPDPSRADHDLLFVGSLSYLPNVDALHRLGGLWAQVLSRRPESSLLVAGARPPKAVRALCDRHGWTLEADFASASDVYGRACIAVNALRMTAGIQNKVLDAAAYGLPQICSPEALRGLAAGFPAEVVSTDADLLDAICSLADDPARRTSLAERQRAEVARYSPNVWAPIVARLLDLT